MLCFFLLLIKCFPWLIGALCVEQLLCFSKNYVCLSKICAVFLSLNNLFSINVKQFSAIFCVFSQCFVCLNRLTVGTMFSNLLMYAYEMKAVDDPFVSDRTLIEVDYCLHEIVC